MDAKKILFVMLFSAILIGSACAAENTTDFKIDESYSNAFNATYYTLYTTDANDAGITIYKNVDDDAYGDVEEGIYDDLIHDDGREYLTGDDDFKLDKNADESANFTDYDHAEHGVVELVKSGGQEFIVTFWAKDTSDVDTAKLINQMNEFNKDNGVEAIAF